MHTRIRKIFRKCSPFILYLSKKDQGNQATGMRTSAPDDSGFSINITSHDTLNVTTQHTDSVHDQVKHWG
jgi:hypothetical protein